MPGAFKQTTQKSHRTLLISLFNMLFSFFRLPENNLF